MPHYKHFFTLLLIVSSCMMAVHGCMVGPDFRPTRTQTPASWTGPTEQMSFTESQQAELLHWWTTFNDDTLTSLVERAMQSNLDVLQAQARIRQARAARGVAYAGLWPIADASAAYTRNRSVGSSSMGTVGAMNNLYHAGLDAAWEADIFGGLRRTVEAADADVLAALEEYGNIQVTLAGEVALNYIDLRTFQQEIIIARNNLEAQQRTAAITRKRFGVGLVSALDVANADAQVATTTSLIPVLETSAQQAVYRLSVLLALEPSALLEELSQAASIPGNPPAIPMLLPSELLLRRPDIRRAEAQIHGATARIGVATADLFPKFNLTGSYGFQGDESGEWIKRADRAWSFGPSVDWNIFDAGRIRANIELQKALQEETLRAYEKTVLMALQEVENALIAYAKEQERRTALLDAVTANRKAVELSTRLYTEGMTDFLNVLIAQRLLFSSEDALALSTRNLSADLVALYKALGGGWESQDPATECD
jgi:NodT family efflux transporter outer membrane factor (OMF) lipoprotein